MRSTIAQFWDYKNNRGLCSESNTDLTVSPRLTPPHPPSQTIPFTLFLDQGPKRKAASSISVRSNKVSNHWLKPGFPRCPPNKSRLIQCMLIIQFFWTCIQWGRGRGVQGGVPMCRRVLSSDSFHSCRNPPSLHEHPAVCSGRIELTYALNLNLNHDLDSHVL